MDAQTILDAIQQLPDWQRKLNQTSEEKFEEFFRRTNEFQTASLDGQDYLKTWMFSVSSDLREYLKAAARDGEELEEACSAWQYYQSTYPIYYADIIRGVSALDLWHSTAATDEGVELHSLIHAAETELQLFFDRLFQSFSDIVTEELGGEL